MNTAAAPKSRRQDKSQRRAECTECNYRGRWAYTADAAHDAAERHAAITGHAVVVR